MAKALLTIFLGVSMVTTVVVGFKWYKYLSTLNREKLTKTTVDKLVVIKENSLDKSKSDVYLKDKRTGDETLFITLSELYRGHVYNNEYHNGNLYVIQRTGGEEGYVNNPNWTDELWRYDQQKRGQKLYGAKGLRFRVADDENLMVVITNEELVLLDNKGVKIKVFNSSELLVSPKENPMFGFLAWGLDAIWLDNVFGPNLLGLVKINTKTYTISKYDLIKLSAGFEYSLNVNREIVAYSDYPALFDVESVDEYMKSKSKVRLMVFDLKSETSQQIAESITEKFNPRWIDEKTLEYNSSKKGGRETKIVAF